MTEDGATPDERDSGQPPRERDVGPLGAAGHLLVSDADRARIADVVGDAYAEGRLTHDEYDSRLATTLAARTVADLVPVLEGLPPAAVAAALAPLAPPGGTSARLPAHNAPSDVERAAWYPPAGFEGASSSVVAVFGGATRTGEWVVPEQLNATAVFGGVELDLTSATFESAESEILAVAVMGGVEITVPEGLAVRVEGVGIFGGFDQRAEGPGRPDAPMVVIKGVALFGAVEVKREGRRAQRRRRSAS